LISRKLNLSEKTISQHKRNAMINLNFKRNVELHFWLLCGSSKDVGRHVLMQPKHRKTPDYFQTDFLI